MSWSWTEKPKKNFAEQLTTAEISSFKSYISEVDVLSFSVKSSNSEFKASLIDITSSLSFSAADISSSNEAILVSDSNAKTSSFLYSSWSPIHRYLKYQLSYLKIFKNRVRQRSCMKNNARLHWLNFHYYKFPNQI